MPSRQIFVTPLLGELRQILRGLSRRPRLGRTARLNTAGDLEPVHLAAMTWTARAIDAKSRAAGGDYVRSGDVGQYLHACR